MRKALLARSEGTAKRPEVDGSALGFFGTRTRLIAVLHELFLERHSIGYGGIVTIGLLGFVPPKWWKPLRPFASGQARFRPCSGSILRQPCSDTEAFGERADIAAVHRVEAAVGDAALEVGEVVAQRAGEGLAREQTVDEPERLSLVGG